MQASRWLIAWALPLFLAGCVPTRDLNPDEIARLDNLEELMWTLATIADPGFALAEDPPVGPASLESFLDMGTRVGLAAERLPQFSEQPGFLTLAEQLRVEALGVAAAARAEDLDEAARLSLQMRNTCSTCHDIYRY